MTRIAFFVLPAVAMIVLLLGACAGSGAGRGMSPEQPIRHIILDPDDSRAGAGAAGGVELAEAVAAPYGIFKADKT